jgi:hypothetical protein
MATAKEKQFAKFAAEVLEECEDAIQALQEAARQSDDPRLAKSGKETAAQMRKEAAMYLGRKFRDKFYPRGEE